MEATENENLTWQERFKQINEIHTLSKHCHLDLLLSTVGRTGWNTRFHNWWQQINHDLTATDGN